MNEDQVDALTEAINIGVGRAAASLGELVEQPIALRVPTVRACRLQELRDLVSDSDRLLDTSVLQNFSGTVNGCALLAFPEKSGAALARILSDEEAGHDELDFDLAGILEEVGNIVLNAVLGSLANLFSGELDYTVPQLLANEAVDQVIAKYYSNDAAEEQMVLMGEAQFDVADSEITGSLMFAFTTDQMNQLLERLIAAAEV